MEIEFPAYRVLKEIGVRAVPYLLTELKNIDRRKDRDEQRIVTHLLIHCLIAIYDQGGRGKELARQRIELEIPQAMRQRERDLLKAALDSPLLEVRELLRQKTR